jgi:hypothetical protein
MTCLLFRLEFINLPYSLSVNHLLGFENNGEAWG